ncbi:MAG: ATP-binding protein [Chitinophagales bacterium]
MNEGVIIRYFILSSILLFCHNISYGQREHLFIRNFSQADYLSKHYTAGPQNFDIISDSRDIMYIANGFVLLEFDGANWRDVKNTGNINNGGKTLASNSMKTIYFGGSDELGYLTPDSTGLICYRSLVQLVKGYHFEIIKTICLNDSVYFVADSVIFRFANHQMDILHTREKITWCGILNNRLTVNLLHRGLYKLFRNNFEFITNTQLFGEVIPVEIIVRSSIPHTPFALMVITRQGIFNWDGKNLVLMNDDKRLTDINCALFIQDDAIAIGTNEHGVLIITNSGKILDNINKQDGLIDNSILGMYKDQNNGLWLALSAGISRIDYPIVIENFNDKNGLPGTVLCSHIYQDKLYAAIYQSGLFEAVPYEHDPHFIKRPSFPDAWYMLDVNNDLFISSTAGVFFQRSESTQRISDQAAYFLYHSPVFEDVVLAGLQKGGIGVIKKDGYGWKYMGKLKGFDIQIKQMVMNSSGILFAGKEKLYKIDFSKGLSLSVEFSEVPVKAAFRADNISYLFSFHNRIYAGTSYEGFLVYDDATNYFVPDTTMNRALGNKGEVAVPYVDYENKIWFLNNQRIGNLSRHNTEYIWDTLPWKKISTGVWNFFLSNDMLWISTTDGLYRYNTSVKKSYDRSFPTLIRMVRVNDTVIFNGAFFFPGQSVSVLQNEVFKKSFPYKTPSVSFDFAAAMYDAGNEVLYSYYLEGQDKTWSAWYDDTRKEYSSLTEGEYVFHVRSKNMYDVVGQEAMFAFSIDRPWYRTWWAYLLYCIGFSLLILAIIRLNQRQLINEKNLLSQKVAERTREISKQKELVESQKENVEIKTRELESTLDALRQAQSQLVHSEKMASVGQLTAGIAHEINNPINFVSSNVNPLKKDIGDIMNLLEMYSTLNESNYTTRMAEIKVHRNRIDLKYTMDEINSLIRGIEEGSRRTAEIVKGLRSFSRLNDEEMVKAEINEGIESTLLLLQNKLRHQNIEVIKSFGDIPEINCFAGQLNQVFLNLLSNAIDAIGHDGKVFITTEVKNDNIKISIRDTGPGMTPEIKQRIFDPFFTTKEVGKGTGLGLSITYGIIEKHRGKVEVRSEVGKGTEFIISLPAQAV